MNQALLDPDMRPVTGRSLNRLRAIEEAAQKEHWSRTERNVKATYFWGAPRTGKTYWLTHTRYKFGEFYAVTDWKNPWDSYEGQSVLILDEYDAQANFHTLCQILEGYPLELPARYANKWAAWDEVWIVSNISLDEMLAAYGKQGINAKMLPSLSGRISEVIHRTEEPGGTRSDLVSVPADFQKLQERFREHSA